MQGVVGRRNQQRLTSSPGRATGTACFCEPRVRRIGGARTVAPPSPKTPPIQPPALDLARGTPLASTSSGGTTASKFIWKEMRSSSLSKPSST